MNFLQISLLLVIGVVATSNAYFNDYNDSSRMLITLAAPQWSSSYYNNPQNPAIYDIVKFHADYVNAVKGNDNIVIIVDAQTKPIYLAYGVPEDILLTWTIFDIWMRDFTSINPTSEVRFKYTSHSMSWLNSLATQGSFTALAKHLGLTYDTTPLEEGILIDGGNIVDSHEGRAIVTTRFAKDNGMNNNETKDYLKYVFNYTEVAVIETDDPILGHSDGMVMWVDNENLLVNWFEEPLMGKIMQELEATFPTVKITLVETAIFQNEPQWLPVQTACGINVNSVLTFNNIYVPTFETAKDQDFLNILQPIALQTNKKVITIPAKNVCAMGGSARCLSQQSTGENAKIMIKAARDM